MHDLKELFKIDEILNTEKCCLIFIDHAIQSGKHPINNSLIFQHDNDPKHNNNAVKEQKSLEETNSGTKSVMVPRHQQY